MRNKQAVKGLRDVEEDLANEALFDDGVALWSAASPAKGLAWARQDIACVQLKVEEAYQALTERFVGEPDGDDELLSEDHPICERVRALHRELVEMGKELEPLAELILQSDAAALSDFYARMRERRAAMVAEVRALRETIERMEVKR